MVDLKDLSKLIRNSRLSKNLSMEEVAKEAGITRATLSEIEKGNSSCSFGNYLKILSILEIDVSVNSLTKKKTRKRATRRILKIDKKINNWVVFIIENYAQHVNKDTNFVYDKLERNGLIDLLYSDYEDLHGMSSEYINDYLDHCFK